MVRWMICGLMTLSTVFQSFKVHGDKAYKNENG